MKESVMVIAPAISFSIAALVAAACGAEARDEDLSVDASGEVAEQEIGPHVESEPSVTILGWNLTHDDAAQIHFRVTGWAFPGGDHAILVYLDDALLFAESESDVVTVDDLPAGQHILALVGASGAEGAWVEYQTPGARAVVTLRVSIPCSGAGDPVCDDGNPCSLDMCSKKDGQWRCDWGIPGYYSNCCSSKYQCSPGQACVSNNCHG
jgi:hypothetical protein